MENKKTMQELFDEMSLLIEDSGKDDKCYGAMCIVFDDGKVSCKAVGNGEGVTMAIADMMLSDGDLANIIKAAYWLYIQCEAKKVEPFYDALSKHIDKIQESLLGGEPKESQICLYSAKFQNRKS